MWRKKNFSISVLELNQSFSEKPRTGGEDICIEERIKNTEAFSIYQQLRELSRTQLFY